MRFLSSQTAARVIATGAFLLATSIAHAQGGAQDAPLMSDQFFKNIQVLKGLPVNEFMATMGFFSASLGYSCENCHSGNSWEEYIADTNPKKRMARGMVAIVNNINKNFFGGRQIVTCYSCHRGSEFPRTTPDLTNLYSPPNEEPEDVVKPGPGGLAADRILDKYIQALGSAPRLAGLTSLVARGTSIGYNLDSDKNPVEIYAKAPNQRATFIHTPAGDSVTTFDGRNGWLAGPQIAGPGIKVPVLSVAGSDVDGARFDAEMSFPGRVKQLATQWRAGSPTEIGDQEVNVVQGNTAGGVLITLYFDTETGLLARSVRYTTSPVGRIPTRVDYSDYRDVAGVKMPFKWTVTWLDGRETFEMTEMHANTAVDPAKFAKPVDTPAIPAAR